MKISSILALGDSYTIGEGVSEKERYPCQVARLLLNTKGYEPDVHIIARTGWITGELAAAIDTADFLTPPYDLVFLLIGVNNQYRGLSFEEYKVEFRRLLQKSIQFSHHKSKGVVVLSIPDWGLTPFGEESGRDNISEEINLFNQVNKEQAERGNCLYVDITSLTREYKDDLGMLTDDKLHYSGKMYGIWAYEILKEIEGRVFY